MPQVVEVLKYVHEIVEEETLGVAVGVDIRTQEARYKELYGKVRVHFETLLVELRKMKTSQPGMKVQIEIIEAFLVELDKIMQFARVVQVEKEKLVEKEVNVPVLVPKKDTLSMRNELSLTLLVEKLIGELKRLKREDSRIRFGLEEDIQLIFFGEFYDGSSGKLDEDLSKQMLSYRESIQNNLLKYGKQWGTDHELILSTVLQERFTLANLLKHANAQIEANKKESDARFNMFNLINNAFTSYTGSVDSFDIAFKALLNRAGPSQEASKASDAWSVFKDSLTKNVHDIRAVEPMGLLNFGYLTLD